MGAEAALTAGSFLAEIGKSSRARAYSSSRRRWEFNWSLEIRANKLRLIGDPPLGLRMSAFVLLLGENLEFCRLEVQSGGAVVGRSGASPLGPVGCWCWCWC